MPWRLLRFALSSEHPEPRMFRAHATLKKSYDVVIIGAGGHGLAAAYYLARDHGIGNVAVLEKGYLGGGNTGRNTTIIRSNYLTPEGVKFYDKSLDLYQDLSEDFDLNLFYSTRGHFTLAHTDSAMRTMRWRAEVIKHHGVDSEVVDAKAVQEACPHMDIGCAVHAPLLGALYYAAAGMAGRHFVSRSFRFQGCRRARVVRHAGPAPVARCQPFRLAGRRWPDRAPRLHRVLCGA